MKAINITLIFDGQTEEAFNFYKSIFGGEFEHLQPYERYAERACYACFGK